MSATLKLDKFSWAAGAVRRGMAKAVKASTFGLQEEAIVIIEENDSIDTGSLRNAVYAEVAGVSERAEKVASALAAARAPGKKSGQPGSPVVAIPETDISGDLMGKVGVCVEHGHWVNQDAPFMEPAVARMKPRVKGLAAQFIHDEGVK